MKEKLKDIVEKLINVPEEMLEKLSEQIDLFIVGNLENLNESMDPRIGLYDISNCNEVELKEKLNSNDIEYDEESYNNKIDILTDRLDEATKILSDCGAVKMTELESDERCVILRRKSGYKIPEGAMESVIPKVTWEDINS